MVQQVQISFVWLIALSVYWRLIKSVVLIVVACFIRSIVLLMPWNFKGMLNGQCWTRINQVPKSRNILLKAHFLGKNGI